MRQSVFRKYYIECILEIATNGKAIHVVESGMNLAWVQVAIVVNDGSVYSNEVLVAIAQEVVGAPAACAPVAGAQVDLGVEGSAEIRNEDNFEKNLTG